MILVYHPPAIAGRPGLAWASTRAEALAEPAQPAVS
jgi:hypothetical protein